ncbi:MAG: hypothetical protein IAE78_25650 [Myxococcus sp.]|nr:hypothetical protein [Myxococcus sp.]
MASRARALLETGRVPNTTATIENGIITNDAPNVNDPRDVSGERARDAKAQLLDNSRLEGDALMGLSPRDRERYQTVKASLLEPTPGKPDGDPVAALALQTMLLEGSLPGERAGGGRDTLLGGLAKLATQEVGAGIDRQQLLSDVVQEVASPMAINQSTKGTCVPTSIQMQLIQNNPAEYVRLVSGLASPAGEVTTAGGDVLKVEPDALTDATGRSVSQRLLAPALMELGNGRADYDNTDDKHTGGDPGSNEIGLTPSQADRVLESLYGRDFAFSRTGSAAEKAAGTQMVMDELAAGRSVLVGLDWTGGGHKVLVTGTETRDGQEYLTIMNPWGRQESILRSEFEERLRNVNYDPNA